MLLPYLSSLDTPPGVLGAVVLVMTVAFAVKAVCSILPRPQFLRVRAGNGRKRN